MIFYFTSLLKGLNSYSGSRVKISLNSEAYDKEKLLTHIERKFRNIQVEFVNNTHSEKPTILETASAGKYNNRNRARNLYHRLKKHISNFK